MRKDDIQSICWMCAKAGGGCSWSERFEPVEGWTARKDTMLTGARDGKHVTDTYTVRKCPEFALERRPNYDVDPDGAKRLAQRVLLQAGRDYRETVEDLIELRETRWSQKTADEIASVKGEKNLIERFLSGGNLFAEILGLDGDALLDYVQKDAAHYAMCGDWR